jgi:putative DNA primase/helicase
VSAAPVRIMEVAGQPVPPYAGPITDVSSLPLVWDLDATIEWLVPDMIPRASVNLISAESGTGKTWLAYAMAGAVAHGAAFIGRAAQPAPVLYLDGENPLYVVKRNLVDLGITATENLRIWGGWNTEPPPGPDDQRVLRFATLDPKPLLIWDSLVEFAHADEQSSTEMREFMKHFRRLAHLGATIIVLHHTGKSAGSKEYRGSSDIKAAVDVAYVVTGKPSYGKLHRLELEPFKSRIAPGQKFAMEFKEG